MDMYVASVLPALQGGLTIGFSISVIGIAVLGAWLVSNRENPTLSFKQYALTTVVVFLLWVVGACITIYASENDGSSHGFTMLLFGVAACEAIAFVIIAITLPKKRIDAFLLGASVVVVPYMFGCLVYFSS